jgi:hypothetical protein
MKKGTPEWSEHGRGVQSEAARALWEKVMPQMIGQAISH